MGHSATLLTTSEVAQLLLVSRRTVRLWAEYGKLPAFKAGRQWRFRRAALEPGIDTEPGTAQKKGITAGRLTGSSKSGYVSAGIGSFDAAPNDET